MAVDVVGRRVGAVRPLQEALALLPEPLRAYEPVRASGLLEHRLLETKRRQELVVDQVRERWPVTCSSTSPRST